jgi:hypothetical protein
MYAYLQGRIPTRTGVALALFMVNDVRKEPGMLIHGLAMLATLLMVMPVLT